ncbi:MAG: SDR family oxidoreductase [Parvularculales bacterium]
MSEHIKGKSIIVTGAASGFGMLVSQKAAEMGAKVTCADIDSDGLGKVVSEITDKGFTAQAVVADVRDAQQIADLGKAAIEKYDAIDVMVNNAGTMPLAFFADHKDALEKWHQCIDINFKGVVNGIAAVHDQMIKQGRGQVINVSSIYGNAPVSGSGIYSATKAAVNFLSETLRVESNGKIKVTTIRPTGVNTNLAGTIVNPAASVGIMGHFAAEELPKMVEQGEKYLANLNADQDSIECRMLDPEQIANNIIYAINQPWGVSISDITIRCSGEKMVL